MTTAVGQVGGASHGGRLQSGSPGQGRTAAGRVGKAVAPRRLGVLPSEVPKSPSSRPTTIE